MKFGHTQVIEYIKSQKRFRLRNKGRTVNALAIGAEEGRDEQRNAAGSSK